MASNSSYRSDVSSKMLDTRVMEILHSLQRHDFPDSVHAALRHLVACCDEQSSSIPGLGMSDEELAANIVDEFIFARPVTRKGGQKSLTYIEELLIQQILINFFESECADSDKLSAAIFSSLFPAQLSINRQSFLSRFLSMAVSVRAKIVLHAAAPWMQEQQHCSSQVVGQMALALISDHCSLLSEGDLCDLPSLSSHFTCHLLTAVTFQHTDVIRDLPAAFFHLVSDWLTADPSLCLSAVMSPVTPCSPVAGIACWYMCSSQRDACWRMHAALLNTMVAFAAQTPALTGSQRTALFSLADMHNIVETALKSKNESTVVTEQLTQLLQVSLATGAFRCSLGDLRNICQRIPQNRLLRIIEKQHLSSAPPKMHDVRGGGTGWSEMTK